MGDKAYVNEASIRMLAPRDKGGGMRRRERASSSFLEKTSRMPTVSRRILSSFQATSIIRIQLKEENMRKLGLILFLLIFSGCAWQKEPRTDGAKSQVPSASARAQYRAAQNAFQEKLNAAPGLTLAELRAQWGQIQQSFTRNNLTIYHWRQTISVTPPAGASAVLDLAGETVDGQALSLSCLVYFIVQSGEVVEASSEGLCLEHGLMPAWNPENITAEG